MKKLFFASLVTASFLSLVFLLATPVHKAQAAGPTCEGQVCGSVRGVTKSCCGSNYTCTQDTPKQYGHCVEKCGHSGDTCGKDSDCCTDLNYACDTQITKTCYDACSSPPSALPTVPPIPKNWKVASDGRDKIPMTVTSVTQNSQSTPFIWSTNGQIKVVAKFSQYYNTCIVNPRDAGPAFGIALSNPDGKFPFNNNQQYTLGLTGQIVCDGSDETKIFVLPVPPKGGWYDIFLTRFIPTNPGDHNLATDLPSGIATDIVPVYVGPDSWTRPVKSPPASCQPTPTPTPTTDPCDALRQNTVLQHGDGCNVAAQCDPNFTQAGKSQTCPTGTTCRAPFNAYAYQQNQTACLYPNEGETKCQHTNQPCDQTSGGRKCCNVGEDGNNDDLICRDNTNTSGSTCQLSVLPSPPAPPCVSFDAKGHCTAVVTALSLATPGNNGTSTDPIAFIEQIFQVLLGVGGGIALLLIMFAGYRLMVSQGKPEAVQQAREQLIAAIVGILFFIFSIVILEAIGVDLLHIPGLGK